MAQRSPRSRFFLCFAVAALCIALAGFSTTFFAPLAHGTFSGPTVVYVHGALLFGWLLLWIAQAAFVQARSMAAHRRAGWLGAGLACAIVVSGLLVGAFATRRDLAATGAEWPYGAFVNIAIEMAVFGLLVGAAVVARRRPESHKRYLVLATITALGPAWFRFRHFLPFVPSPLVTFSFVADSVLVVAMVRDWWARRLVHPVYVWAGGAMVGVHCVELAAGESRAWVLLGRWLLGPS